MQPFQEISTDFIKEATKILEEFQAQCQAITCEFLHLDHNSYTPCFKYTPNENANDIRGNATYEDIKLKIIDISKNSPKELLLSSHFVNKVKNNLEAEGLSATKVKIRKIIENLRSEGTIEIPEFDE